MPENFYVPNTVWDTEYKTMQELKEARKAALAEARASLKMDNRGYDPEKRTYRGIHLDEWRELVDKSYIQIKGSPNHERNYTELDKKLMEVGGTSAGLTDALYADWTPHFGYPEKLDARSASNSGFIRLCAAVVNTYVDEIMDYEVALATGGYNSHEKHVDMKLLGEIAEKAKSGLRSEHMQLFLLGMDPDAVIRMCPKNARAGLEKTYGNAREELAKEIQESGTTMEELMEALDLNREQLAAWLMWPYKNRRRAIKKFIKERRNADGNRDEGTGAEVF